MSSIDEKALAAFDAEMKRQDPHVWNSFVRSEVIACLEAYESAKSSEGDEDANKVIERVILHQCLFANEIGNITSDAARKQLIEPLQHYLQPYLRASRPNQEMELPSAVKFAIADNITIESRSKADVVQDVYDELRPYLRTPAQVSGDSLDAAFKTFLAKQFYDDGRITLCTTDWEYYAEEIANHRKTWDAAIKALTGKEA